MAPTCFGLRPSSGSFQLNLLQFTLILDGSYIFRSTTIIREHAIEPG